MPEPKRHQNCGCDHREDDPHGFNITPPEDRETEEALDRRLMDWYLEE